MIWMADRKRWVLQRDLPGVLVDGTDVISSSNPWHMSMCGRTYPEQLHVERSCDQNPGSEGIWVSMTTSMRRFLNVGPVSIWDVEVAQRTSSTLAVTTLRVSEERLAKRQSSEKRLTNWMIHHDIIILLPQLIHTSLLTERCQELASRLHDTHRFSLSPNIAC